MAENPLPGYLDMLNPEQLEAVLHTGGDAFGEGAGGVGASPVKPLLILAGAGSGKTRVITTKIAYLIRERGVDPRSILAVTFTNKAAREMAERAAGIDERAGNAMLRTFHSFGAWFLRRNGALAGLNSNFVIYDEDDTVSLLASLMDNAPKAEVKDAAHSISRAKDYFLGPGDPELETIDHRKKFRKIYERYEEKLSQIGNVDFGDLIKKPVEILRANPDVARRLRDRFRVIMVDEYQDSNVAQFELLKELRGSGTYVCVVGDDDQSIYSFRGAELRNILEFPERFAGADIIRLERNYRSTEPILRLASSVVDCNKGRLGKTLRSERGGGSDPVLAFLPDQDAEVGFCAELIENSVRGKRGTKSAYSDWAILYRMNAQSMGFETEFLRRRIPYRVVGSLKFYEREEIKDALALLSFLVNPRDEVAFRRVVNKPSRGVGAATIDRVIGAVAGLAGDAGSRGGDSAGDGGNSGDSPDSDTVPGDLAAAARRVMPGLPAKAREGLSLFLGAIEAGRQALNRALPESPPRKNLPRENRGGRNPPSKNAGASAGKRRETLRAGEGLSPCLVALIGEAGIADYHLAHDEIGGVQRIANLQELVNAASIYPLGIEGLLEFLEHIELDRSLENTPDGESNTDTVTLITLHNTKGLEFRRVIMTGVEQGIFPRDDKKDEGLEEERRLFYVGATRAMDELYLCSCGMRRIFGRSQPMEPSLFLREAAGRPGAGKAGGMGESPLRILGSAPCGFSGISPAAARPSFRGGFSAAPGGGFSRGAAGSGANSRGRRSSDGRWAVGDRIFHDDHGYGAVIEIRESGEDGPVIRARFDTGKELRFLSACQSGRFTKIGDD
ncbi:MAG: ATP-dependent helicase [Spirochaetaceae bacterium]|jgi:DNA helicase-2/ATP-dependent DNA helicase PcrA|nr:ATP-dependent helicase [Spirochaetaceae bacterium]